MARWPQPFYVTTPIYYVNDVPHIGHAYTTVAADVLARWRRLWGDDVVFLTGTDEHGLKIQRAAEEHGVTPQEWADRTSERFREAWKLLDITNDDFIRTTEPRHYAAVAAVPPARVRQRLHRARTPTRASTASPARRITPRTSSSTATARSTTARSSWSPRRTTSSSSRGSRTRCSSTTRRIPTRCSPSSKRNEVLGFIKQGLQRLLDEPHVDHAGAFRCRGTSEHVTYVWFDALFNYCTAVGYGDDRARFDRYWPVDYHLIGKDILRFHAVYWPAMLMAAGEAPPKCVFAHGYLLVGGEKMSKTRLNQIAPADLVAEFGSDGFRYHFLADQRFGPDGDFSYEAMVARYNADLANNFGNLANRVLNMAVNYCDGVVPDDARQRPARRQAATQAFDQMTAAMTQLDYDAALRRGVGADPRDELATSRTRSRGSSTRPATPPATAAVLGDCLEALRIVALLASPVIPAAAAELWRRLGLPGTARGPAPPRGRRLGPAPRRRRPGEGRPPLPPADEVVTCRRCRWVDSHCHPQMATGGADAAIERARDAGCHGDGRGGHRPRVVARRRSSSRAVIPTCSRPSDLHPHDASRLDDEWDDARRARERRRRSSPSAKPGSTSTTCTPRPTRRTPRSAPRSVSPHDLDRALVIHSREAWDDTFRVLAEEGVPRPHGVPLLHRRSRTKPTAPSTSAPRSASAGSCRSSRPTTCAAAAALLPRRPRCSWRPTRPYLAPVPYRGKENEPAFDRRGRRGAGRRGRPRPGHRRRVDRGRRPPPGSDLS